MKISLRKKSKTILLCLVVMCLIFVNIKVSAQPIVRITTCPQTVEPDRILYLDIEFEYEDVMQEIYKVWLYYYVNNYTIEYYETFNPDTKTPEEMSLEISTFGLNLVHGDTLMIKIVCEWGNALGSQGNIIIERIIDVSEDISRSGFVTRSIFVSIILMASVKIFFIKNKKQKKAQRAT